MATDCRGRIQADLLENCENIVAGINDTAYLINIDDIDKDNCKFDPDNPILLTQLVLKTASPALKAFKIVGRNYSNEHKATLVKKTYQKMWDHGFIFRIFDNDPPTKHWIYNSINSRFAVIQENNYHKLASPAGNTVFEVLGWDMGLEINAAERDANSDELMGGWLITGGPHEKMKESKPPLAFYVGGSITSTRAAIAALL
jgi:hypothetical protein